MKAPTFLLALVASAGLVMAEDAPAKPEGGKRPPMDPAEAFKKLDKNADGKVSQEEFLASKRWENNQDKGKEAFAKADADKDGSVTLEEFKAHLAKRGGKGGPGGEGGKGKGPKGDKPADKPAGQ